MDTVLAYALSALGVAGLGTILACMVWVRQKQVALRRALDLVHRLDDRITLLEDSQGSLRHTLKNLQSRAGMREMRDRQDQAKKPLDILARADPHAALKYLTGKGN